MVIHYDICNADDYFFDSSIGTEQILSMDLTKYGSKYIVTYFEVPLPHWDVTFTSAFDKKSYTKTIFSVTRSYMLLVYENIWEDKVHEELLDNVAKEIVEIKKVMKRKHKPEGYDWFWESRKLDGLYTYFTTYLKQQELDRNCIACRAVTVPDGVYVPNYLARYAHIILGNREKELKQRQSAEHNKKVQEQLEAYDKQEQRKTMAYKSRKEFSDLDDEDTQDKLLSQIERLTRELSSVVNDTIIDVNNMLF